MRKYFGTDGIRGIANVPPLDPEMLVRLGKAISTIFLKEDRKHRILIGKDTRLSGYMIEHALAAGITSSGVDVLLTGPVPTPGVAYLTKSMRADAGIMISASHNSYEDNGIKIFASDGYKLPDKIELEIEALIDKNEKFDKKTVNASDIGKASRIDDALGRYTVFLKSCFPRELSLENMKIGVDCANGAGYVVAPQTFRELGAEVVSRGTSPSGRNINSGFGSLYPEVVRKLVAEQNLDLGIALDGDGDRAVFVDEKGKLHDGDEVLAICALDYKRRGKLAGNTVVATVMSNFGLEKALKAEGIDLIRTQVGDRYVLEAMLKNKCLLGGEQSGHMIFSDTSTTGDGILSSLMLMAVMQRTGKRLSELGGNIEKMPQRLVNIKVSRKPDLESIPSIRDIINKKEKELDKTGRILVRYSGTENKARVMVECEDEDLCIKHASDVAEVIEKELGVTV